ncbi:hypothetical protein [Mesorhizobium sp. ES1-1]|uniref:hypothetical protein n=1 Tax=Mesorhizobium sp. ES1-1 TaxID=2876629 RepID=UPI001CCA64B1|nr:hypothetical protein [Mesorhizobium sp. ES1-1]MBZ9674585.1 hypothetical protein [Mesorhizobium sp. ES1-1]
MTDCYSEFEYDPGLSRSLALVLSGHPDDVLNDPGLTKQQKRALLASWASDANAVPHLPALRQLPDGSILKVDDILRALKALDGGENVTDARANRTSFLWRPSKRWRSPWSRGLWRKSDGSDDDDPPPAPAFAMGRPKGRDGGDSVFAYSQAAAA